MEKHVDVCYEYGAGSRCVCVHTIIYVWDLVGQKSKKKSKKKIKKKIKIKIQAFFGEVNNLPVLYAQASKI